MNQALQHLKFFAFEGQKAKGPHGGLVGIESGYRQGAEGVRKYEAVESVE